jgi:3-dehydroquinate dehydratase-2
MKVTIINGPNLNLLGSREPEIYGTSNFEEIISNLRKQFPNIEISYFQSNVEGELINCLHERGFSDTAIIINAGAYTHTSIALADAVAAISSPVIEVHISNIFAREAFRHVSYIGAKCIGSISGFGIESYVLALQYVSMNLLKQ